MKKNFKLTEIEQLVNQEFTSRMHNQRIFTFKGPLGAGKTTLIKQILKKFGVGSIITSPTFAYVNTYKSKHNKTFHHFDLYRLDNLESFISLGFDEYLHDKDAYCFIEWPEIITDILQNSSLHLLVCEVILSFDSNDFEKRSIELK